MAQYENAARLVPLTSVEQLSEVLAQSAVRPAVIFKHSDTCGRSAMAAEEVAQWLDASRVAADVYVVDVRRSRAVARAVAERLDVRHESPQVLVVRDGSVSWHRSHMSITARAIEAALLASTGSPTIV